MHSTANLPLLSILKNSIFFEENPNFVPFEKSYHFNRILRQICYNLVLKAFRGQNRQTADNLTSHLINWQKHKKNVHFEWIIFSHI